MAGRVVKLRKNGPRNYDVYIGRGGPYGNPFRLREDTFEERRRVLALYRIWLELRTRRDAIFRRQVLALRGKVLGCFCVPKLCHGFVILEWLRRNRE